MTLASKLKVKGVKINKGPVWLGPHSDEWNGGLTYSMLVQFINCKERFRVKYCEGLRTKPVFQHRMEYGNLWHCAEEAYAANKDWQKPLKAYAQKLCQGYRLEQQQVQHWYNVCRVTFPHYINHWANHKDVKKREPLLQEHVFDVPYSLPSRRTVRLRGKWDSVDRIGKKVWLQENKARGDIDELKTASQMRDDLQSMLYAAALSRTDYGVPAGIRYNVARRPLSGGLHSIRQKKDESEGEFYDRLGVLIGENTDHYFARWNVEFLPSDLYRWELRTLIPLLEQVCDWWEYMELCNFDPWSQSPESNKGRHWQFPHGTYSTLMEGGCTELDEYLSTGTMTGLHKQTELFNELK